jgi:hypothetical protein
MQMNSIILVFTALLLIIASGPNNQLAQRMASSPDPVDEKCPVIIVECQNWASSEDSPLIFNVTVTGVEEGAKLEYEWKPTSRGKIKTGQGTTSITLEAEHNGSSIGVLVEVKGLPEGRDGKASNTITHY